MGCPCPPCPAETGGAGAWRWWLPARDVRDTQSNALIPLGNACSPTPSLGVLRSQTCIGQPFLTRSCRSELPAVCFSFCVLHRPGVPQRLVMRPHVEYQRYSGHGGINAPTSGRCEEETGAVTASPCSCKPTKPYPPLRFTYSCESPAAPLPDQAEDLPTWLGVHCSHGRHLPRQAKAGTRWVPGDRRARMVMEEFFESLNCEPKGCLTLMRKISQLTGHRGSLPYSR